MPKRQRTRTIEQDQRLTFGKHSGKTFSWVINNDMGYAKWAIQEPRTSMNSQFNQFIDYIWWYLDEVLRA